MYKISFFLQRIPFLVSLQLNLATLKWTAENEEILVDEPKKVNIFY